MLSHDLTTMRDAIKTRKYRLTDHNIAAIVSRLSSAIEAAQALEAQVVSAETRDLPYPDNVINIAAILHRHGVTAGLSTSSNDGGAA